MKNTILQVLCIGVAGLGLGLGSNAVRSDGRVKLTRNYFGVFGGDGPSPVAPGGDATDGDAPRSTPRPTDGTEGTPPSHGFTVVSLDDMADLYMSAAYAEGAVVFVDARDDEHFSEAHIPGAIHIDRYNSDQDFNSAETALSEADTIVVYCGGGDCEDSIYLATEFVDERNISVDKILLFEGGMQAWEGDNLEVEGSETQ